MSEAPTTVPNDWRESPAPDLFLLKFNASDTKVPSAAGGGGQKLPESPGKYTDHEDPKRHDCCDEVVARHMSPGERTTPQMFKNMSM